MFRYVVVFVYALALIAMSGCAMCASPYDYCGPTFTMEPGQTCHPLARANSRLSPPLETAEPAVAHHTVAPSPTIAPRPQQATPTQPKQPSDPLPIPA